MEEYYHVYLNIECENINIFEGEYKLYIGVDKPVDARYQMVSEQNIS